MLFRFIHMRHQHDIKIVDKLTSGSSSSNNNSDCVNDTLIILFVLLSIVALLFHSLKHYTCLKQHVLDFFAIRIKNTATCFTLTNILHATLIFSKNHRVLRKLHYDIIIVTQSKNTQTCFTLINATTCYAPL